MSQVITEKQTSSNFFKDISISAINAGFVTVLVGIGSSAVIIMQAAQSLGATPEIVASWMWALGLGMGLSCIGLSIKTRAPIATAWSTAGAAMLTASAGGVTMPEAVGAFLVTGLLISIAGFSGWFEAALNKIPVSIAGGMLAGVLLRFGIDAFGAAKGDIFLVVTLLLAYLAARRYVPRYSAIITLVLGMIITGVKGTLHLEQLNFELTRPVFIAPEFSWQAMIGVALPLFIVTMASQNVPAVAVLKSSDYSKIPVSPLIGWTGITTFVLAPFGAYALNLATITAAICIGKEAHEDPQKRYVASIFAGIFYCLTGLFSATVVAMFVAFPKELVQVVAGLALVGTIGGGLASAVKEERQREPALITFLATASGATLFGIGSAFWGLVAGGVAAFVLGSFSKPKEETPAR